MPHPVQPEYLTTDAAILEMASHNLAEIYQRFRGTYCLHLQFRYCCMSLFEQKESNLELRFYLLHVCVKNRFLIWCTHFDNGK